MECNRSCNHHDKSITKVYNDLSSSVVGERRNYLIIKLCKYLWQKPFNPLIKGYSICLCRKTWLLFYHLLALLATDSNNVLILAFQWFMSPLKSHVSYRVLLIGSLKGLNICYVTFQEILSGVVENGFFKTQKHC